MYMSEFGHLSQTLSAFVHKNVERLEHINMARWKTECDTPRTHSTIINSIDSTYQAALFQIFSTIA
jgi:hypothetical protein